MRLELNVDFESLFAPSEFFFGVANAPYLCEGGYNTRTGPKNSFGVLEAAGKMEASGEAQRFWTDYADHIKLAASLGLNAFRMGLEWARVQPSPSMEPHDPPEWDTAALDRYADIVAMVIENGMQPIITLHHFTHPLWAGLNLWLEDRGPDMLVEYEMRVVDEINTRLLNRGSDVMRHFLVYNEPNQIALFYHFGLFPLPVGSEYLLPVFDNMVSRYVKVYDGLYDLFESAAGASRTWATRSAAKRRTNSTGRCRTSFACAPGAFHARAWQRPWAATAIVGWRGSATSAHSQLTDAGLRPVQRAHRARRSGAAARSA